MKALIRNENETVRETDGIDGIDWTTGAPLTNPAWCGGPYAICEDCPVSDPDPADFDITTIEVPDTAAPAEEDGTAEVPTIPRRQAVLNTDRYNARLAREAQEPAQGNEAPQAEEVPAEVPAEPVEAESDAPAEDPEPPADDGDETVTINGVVYTKAQLRALMGE